MGISGFSDNIQTLTDTGFDANNTASVTSSIKMDGSSSLGFYIADNTGTHATHEIEIQVSLDNSTWLDTNIIITGIGVLASLMCVTNFTRAKCKTAEGGVSTVDIDLIVK